VKTQIVPLVTSDHARALIGDAVKGIVTCAVDTRTPIVIEKIDFKKKKSELEAEHPGQARMISSLAYNKIIQSIHSTAYRSGIEVIEVNPAFTSTIGAVNYAKSYGISIHKGAALAIAQRSAGFRERPIPVAGATVPTAKIDHVTYRRPARNRGKHVWSFWADVRKIQVAAHTAHLRPPKGEPLRPDRPSQVGKPAKGKAPRFTVRPRDASRWQNCSATAIGDVPW